MHHAQRVLAKGFALPTVLIASVVLLSILAVSVSATSAIRTTLKNQYYAQMAQIAGEAGVAYAKACLAMNGNVPLWTDAKPLKPSTDCSGDPLVGSTVKILVVAGGGSGGTSSTSQGGGGGGGAGGYLYNDSLAVTPQTYNVTVGGSGAAATGASVDGISGGNSIFANSSGVPIMTAIGGGGGGRGHQTTGNSGLSGGSGGGAGYKNYTNVTGASGTAGQGNAGGNNTSNNNGGGGGGAGGVGGNTSIVGTGGIGGAGGVGVSNSITGAALTYAKGGDGTTNGGGFTVVSGATNTGNGGSGGPYGATGTSGAGGSGVVIISYPSNSGISVSGASGGTETTAGLYKVRKYTTSGTFIVSSAGAISCPTDPRCSVSVNGNARSSFTVSRPTLDSQGKAVTVGANGYTEILRSSNSAVWRTINQPSIQPTVVPDLCSNVATSAQGWNTAVRASTQDALDGASTAQSISVANTNLNAGAMYYRRDISVNSAGTYNIKVLSGSTQDIAEVYVGSQKVATSSGSVASGSVTLSSGCQTVMVKLTNVTLDPRTSRFTASIQKNDGSMPIAVTDTSWRTATGDSVHYSSPNYYASPAHWVPVRDYNNSTYPWNPAQRGITTPVAQTAGFAYFRDNRTVTVSSTTPINGYFACSTSCTLYLDGEAIANGVSTLLNTFNTTLQPGDHKFALRQTGTYLFFTALRDSDGAVLSQTDTNWSTTNAWTTSQDYYSYDTEYVPVPNSIPTGLVSVLAVGGGGGGGTGMGGGGGGGGVVYDASYSATGSIDVTVGAGGTGAVAGLGVARGVNGGDSKFGSITAFGGGGGGTQYSTNTYPPGSGGSGGGNAAYLQTTPAIGILGQGYNGAATGGQYYPGGGGGAGGPGATNPAHGGVGIYNDILGSPCCYWGGGGGGSGYSGIGGNGGNGGGGGGAIGVTTGGSGLNAGSPGGGGAVGVQANKPGGNAGANTGGGGGGGGHYNATNAGGNGGSGIVVISYGSDSGIIATGGTITTVGSRTVHTFLSSGTFTITKGNS